MCKSSCKLTVFCTSSWFISSGRRIRITDDIMYLTSLASHTLRRRVWLARFIHAKSVASSPGHSPIFLHSCEIKSGSGLGMGLLSQQVLTGNLTSAYLDRSGLIKLQDHKEGAVPGELPQEFALIRMRYAHILVVWCKRIPTTGLFRIRY